MSNDWKAKIIFKNAKSPLINKEPTQLMLKIRKYVEILNNFQLYHMARTSYVQWNDDESVLF